MTLTEYIANISQFITTITARLLAVPKLSGLVIDSDNTAGMHFMSGFPISMFNIVTNEQERTALQAGVADYFDVRTSTYWTKASGSWVSSAYTGTKPFLRPGTLVLGTNTGTVYFFNDQFLCTLVDTTTAA